MFNYGNTENLKKVIARNSVSRKPINMREYYS